MVKIPCGRCKLRWKARILGAKKIRRGVYTVRVGEKT